MTIKLKPYQRERIARGPLIKYQGPMSEFSKFLESDPAKKTVYNNAIAQIDQKMAIKMQSGGDVKSTEAERQEIAQELLNTYPSAVDKRFGYYCVDYDKLGIEFQEVKD